MPKTHLTAKGLDALKPGNAPQTDYFDDSLPGFAVRVSEAGRKSFIVFYRFAGKLRRHTLGTYPPMSLADARDGAKLALHDVQMGIDPATRKADARKAETFGEISAEYIERHAKPNKKSWKEDDRLLTKHCLPAWKNIRARELSRADVRKLLDEIVVDGKPILANRVRALLSMVFNWAIGRDLLEFNPVSHIPRPAKESRRDRVLSEKELKTLWDAISAYPRKRMAATFEIRMLTAQRGGEVFSMEWADLDLDGGWWTIPAEKAKNGLAHRVPLNAPALKIIEGMKEKAQSSRWVFPIVRRQSTRDDHLYNVQKFVQKLREDTKIEFRGHDLRRTASSLMTGMGVSRLVVSKILNHAETNVTAVYDRHSYDQEKREALDAWGRRLMMIVSGLREASAQTEA